MKFINDPDKISKTRNDRQQIITTLAVNDLKSRTDVNEKKIKELEEAIHTLNESLKLLQEKVISNEQEAIIEIERLNKLNNK